MDRLEEELSENAALLEEREAALDDMTAQMEQVQHPPSTIKEKHKLS